MATAKENQLIPFQLLIIITLQHFFGISPSKCPTNGWSDFSVKKFEKLLLHGWRKSMIYKECIKTCADVSWTSFKKIWTYRCLDIILQQPWSDFSIQSQNNFFTSILSLMMTNTLVFFRYAHQFLFMFQLIFFMHWWQVAEIVLKNEYLSYLYNGS